MITSEPNKAAVLIEDKGDGMMKVSVVSDGHTNSPITRAAVLMCELYEREMSEFMKVEQVN